MPKLTMHELTGLPAIDEFKTLTPRERQAQVLELGEKAAQLPGAAAAARASNLISKAVTRRKFTELLMSQMANIESALQQLHDENPKVYLDKVYELAQFSTPMLKAVEIDASANNESAKDMSLAALQAALTDETVVSIQ